MARVAVTISLSDDERAELEALSRRRKTSQGLARRARIVLAAAEGLENKEIAVRLEASADTVGKWRRRYAAEGLDGLYDEPRPGAPRQIGDDAIAEAVRLTLEETPPRDPLEPSLDGAGERPRALDHSSHLAGLRCSRIRRPSSCRARGEGPRHRRSVFGAAGSCPGSLCRRKEPDPGLGPFPAPLADAPREAERSHDYKRHGTTSLFAALGGRDHRQMFPAPSGPRSANSSTSSRRTSLLISTSTSSDGSVRRTPPRAPRQIGDDAIAEAVRLTLEETPPDATHWSHSMARASGHAPSTIHRIWRAFGLQPHRSETFKLSSDPFFVEKVRDIVLYLAPPDRALVLCVDEKSQRPWTVPSPSWCAPGRRSGAATTRHGTPSRPSTSPRERTSRRPAREGRGPPTACPFHTHQPPGSTRSSAGSGC